MIEKILLSVLQSVVTSKAKELFAKIIEESKLVKFGFYTYIDAAIEQANESFNVIAEDSQVKKYFIKEKIEQDLSNVISEINKNFEPSDYVLLFSPEKHPASVFIKNVFIKLFLDYQIDDDTQNKFIKDFNQKIEKKVQEKFGEETYQKHLEIVRTEWLRDNETKFLLEMQKLGKIGFTEDELFTYQKTLGKWESIEKFRGGDSDEGIKEEDFDKLEKSLCPLEDLIDEYFPLKEENYFGKILFVIADFGKGKSVFLKHLASQYAANYLQKAEGVFPVYFNLRDYGQSTYQYASKLGVIANYLETEFKIDLNSDEYFKKKTYLFLIDSLDESGELSARNIDEVIKNIRQIENIDKTNSRKNRIILSSRPFDDGLKKHLTDCEPFSKEDEQGRKISQFASVYGFTKSQFNVWLVNALLSQQKKIKNPAGLLKTIYDEHDIEKKFVSNIDIYSKLFGMLKRSELKRPIFGYMIYHLIINNIEIENLTKIGVYLSFLNLLTRKAKFKGDSNEKVDLKEEFKFRNMLHATAALWMYEKEKGKQGSLKKIDICQTIAGKKLEEKNLGDYKKIYDVEFLSHSYFGDNGDTLHFHHQSFAEILLAEYYLKIFIKYALDETANAEEARVKLLLGNPTDQTIEFFKELVKMLKNSVNNTQMREQLFPLFASLATTEHNTLFSNAVFYDWFKPYVEKEIVSGQKNIPQKAIDNWLIDKVAIDKIILLAETIIKSEKEYLLTQASTRTTLFNEEIIALQQSTNTSGILIDKWLALLIGNLLETDTTSNTYFNKRIPDFFITIFHINKYEVPEWLKEFFIGIDWRMSLNINLYNFNFSYANIEILHLYSSRLISCNFNHSNIKTIVFDNTILFGTKIFFQSQNIRLVRFSNCYLSSNLFGFDLEIYLSLKPYLFGDLAGVIIPRKINSDNQQLIEFQRQLPYFSAKDVMESQMVFINKKNVQETLSFFSSLYKLLIDRYDFTFEELKKFWIFRDVETEETFDKWLSELVSSKITEN